MSQNKKYLQEIAELIDKKLPDNHGFILLAVPRGNDEGARLSYVSSLRRETAIHLLKEWLIKCSADEDWMKHLK